MKAKSFLLTISILVFLFTIGGFFWLNSSVNSVDQSYFPSEDLQPVDVSSIKKDATDILDGSEKNSDIPIVAPAASPSGKMGKTNPFSGI